jgi:DNA repair protein RecN (Recombination protein N)
LIEHIHVQNVALIKDIDLYFDKGLNIISGETGAGKSMLINSIGFLLGQKPNKNFLPKGEKIAQVKGLFVIKSETVIKSLQSIGINISEDKKILIHRSFTSNGKSSCFINGKPTTISVLKEVSSLLIDIHGQHEHQSLLDPSKHILLLDIFCGLSLKELKHKLGENLKSYKATVNKINSILGDSSGSTIELLKFQIEDIENANIHIDEEEALLGRRKLLSGYSKISLNISNSLQYLEGMESYDISAIGKVDKSFYLLKEVSSYDNSQKHITDGLENISIQLNEFCTELRKYSDNFKYDSTELMEIEHRLNIIYDIKRRYGGSVQKALEYYDSIKDKIALIENSEEQIYTLKLEKKKYANEILLHCKEISLLRAKSSTLIKTKIELLLNELGMTNAKFDIKIERKQSFGANGYDDVEFLISSNPGDPLKPLSKIASGGEMSRIMLAIKTVLASYDNIETFIFDEIDTGISGRTAVQVAQKLYLISKQYQIICITHLAQIGAMSDTHFLIEKSSIQDTTTTNVYPLNYEGSVKELARLIGGVTITESTIKTAREMRQQAIDLKSIT